MHFKISILSTNCFMAIYEILFNVDSIQALQCEIFSYVYELNLYSVYSWQIIILLELSRHPIELSIKLIVLPILFYSTAAGATVNFIFMFLSDGKFNWAGNITQNCGRNSCFDFVGSLEAFK